MDAALRAGPRKAPAIAGIYARRWTAAVFFTLVFAAALSAQDTYPRGRIIGSVEIPALHDVVNKGTANPAPGSVALYSTPEDGTPIATIKDHWEIQTLEHGYEQISAAVFQRTFRKDELWYQVRFKTAGREGIGWLMARNVGQFRFLHELLTSHRGFLTDAWDRVLYEAPNRDAKRRTLTSAGERQDVIVATMMDERGDAQNAWMLVVLTDGSFCDRGSQAVIAAGWIPAYSAAGNLTSWYYSRGC